MSLESLSNMPKQEIIKGNIFDVPVMPSLTDMLLSSSGPFLRVKRKGGLCKCRKCKEHYPSEELTDEYCPKCLTGILAFRAYKKRRESLA